MTHPLLGGRYQPQHLLASHDAVQTWRGTDVTNGTAVIIKLLNVSRAASTQEVELFERQGSVMSQLEHPNIPKVLAVQQQELDGHPHLVLVTEFVDGKDLEARIRAGMSLDERGIILLGIEVARILEFLHARLPPVVHRDVKPSNLVQTAEGQLHLVDFGSVKLPSTNASSSRGATVVGTFGYMPPEQFEGGASPASDVHALGMTLLFLATHKHPWDHGEGGPRAAMSTALGMTSGFRNLLRRMTEPDPRTRMANGAVARLELEALLRPSRRAPLLWMAAAAGFLLTAGAGATVYFTSSPKPATHSVFHPTVVEPIRQPPPEALKIPPAEVRPPIFFDGALGQAHRCFARAVPRVLQSRARYLSWVSKDGPTCKERYISYGLYQGYEDAITQCDFSTENAPESVHPAVREVAVLTREAIGLLKTADRYYDESRYKDDECKGARSMHSALSRVFEGMVNAGLRLEAALLTADEQALTAALTRHKHRPLLRDAVTTLQAYQQVALLSPLWGGDPVDKVRLLAAVQEALDRAEVVEAGKANARDLSDAEKTALDSIISHASAYRSLARTLRDSGVGRKEPTQHDPLETRVKFLEQVVDIFLWAETRR